MSLILLSIAIRVFALGWSVVLVKRFRDWRIAFLSIMLALMAMRQILTLWNAYSARDLSFTAHLSELPGLVVSVMAAAAVYFLSRMFADQRRVEHALHMNERQLRRVLDNSPEALMILDVTAGRFAVLNEPAVQLFGWPMKKLLEMTVSDVSPPFQPDGRPSLAAAGAMLQEAIDGGEPVFPWVHQNADGQKIPCEVRLIRIPHESRILVRASVVDVSERLRSEDELRRSEERFRAAVSAQREMVFRWRPDGTRTFVNHAFCRYFGCTEEKALGTSFLQELDQDERARVRANLSSLTLDEPMIVSEIEVPARDGQRRWVEWSDNGIFDLHGRLVEIQSSGRDITARRRVQEDLENAQSFLTAAVEASPAGIIIADAPDADVRVANRAVMDILGTTEDTLQEVVEQVRRQSYFRPDGSRIGADELPMYRALNEGETTRPSEMRIQRGDGHERWIANSGAPVRNAAGEVIAGIAVATDITDIKRTQLAIRSVVASVSAVTGKEFCEVLVLQLSKVLNAEMGLIVQVAEEPDRIQMLALAMDGELTSQYPDYDSRNAPSGEVIRQRRCMAWDNVREVFPKDPNLAEHEVNGYVGVPLLARGDRPLGMLAVLSRKPMDNVQFKMEILQLFAVRAAAELEREHTALALVQSEERFRTAFEEAPIGAVIVDRDGWMRRPNKTFCRITGYAAQELANKRLRDLMHLDEMKVFLGAKERMVGGELAGDAGEGRLIRRDNRIAWVNYSAQRMPDPSGEVRFLVMIEDTTARMKAEQDLRVSRELQGIVAEVSARFAGAAGAEVDPQVSQALGRVGEFLDIDRIALYAIDNGVAKSIQSWFRDGRQPAVLEAELSQFPGVSEHVLAGRAFKFCRLADLPAEYGAERALVSRLGIKSWICIPLQVKRALAGVFVLAADRTERAWPPELVEWLRVLGEMLASVMARTRAEEQVRANMETQRLVTEISASLVNASADRVADRIQDAMARVGEFVGCDRVSLYWIENDIAELTYFWQRPGIDAPAEKVSFSTQVPFVGRAMIEGRVLCFRSCDELPEEMSLDREFFRRLGTRSLLGVPVQVGDSRVGAFNLATLNSECDWQPELVQWMRVLGNILAGALARQRAEENRNASRRQLRGLTHELTRVEDAERRRCATYLHDQIGQTLAVMRMKLGQLLARGSREENQERIVQIRELIEKAIEDTQTLTFDLSPPLLYELGLTAALEWIGEKICDEHELEFELEVEEAESRIPRDAETSSILFRAVRELLMNVVKHAAATTVKVRVESTAAGIHITVRDDGVGFDTSLLEPAKATKRFGLFSIRERLEFVGGRFQVSSRTGHGTRVNLFAPAATASPVSEAVLK